MSEKTLQILGFVLFMALILLGIVTYKQNKAIEQYKGVIGECWSVVLNADENIAALDLQIMNAKDNPRNDYTTISQEIKSFETKEQVKNPCFVH